MHADEFPIDEDLVRRLLAAQFPVWSVLPIERVKSDGTDHAIFRLGTEVMARLPRRPSAAGQIAKEHAFAAVLAPWLPFPIPVPIERGGPGEGYPWAWSVSPWLPGNTPAPEEANTVETAKSLGGFVKALRAIDATGGPEPGDHNSWRGVPLARRDAAVRRALGALDGMIDTRAALAMWEADRGAAPWSAPPVWIHGDLAASNLLMENGGLSAVIDLGCLGVGDPACDLQPAWNIFTGNAREAFREAIDLDAATWARGRAWALSVALIQLPYYRDTDPTLARSAARTIAAVLGDQGSSSTR